MAKIGLRNFRYSVLDEDFAPTGPKSLGKAVSCQVSVSNNSATLYADDSLAESDFTFSNATVTLGVDDERDATFAELLGHTISGDGEVVCNANDIAPYVALGRIVTKIVGNERKYKVEFLHKVKFQEPSADETTKGETVEFATTTIEGTASTLPDGDWRKAMTFDTYDEADAYLDELLAASEDDVDETTPTDPVDTPPSDPVGGEE